MAISSIIFIWALTIYTILSVNNLNVVAQTSPPAPAAASPGPVPATSDCMTLIYNMSDCLTYVEIGSNVTKPETACCPELAGMVGSNPLCLCKLLGKSKDFSVELDVDKALKLPGVCGLNAPSVSSCADAGMPIGGPAGAPSSSSGPSGGTLAEAGEASPVQNEASDAYFGLLYLIAGFAIALM